MSDENLTVEQAQTELNKVLSDKDHLYHTKPGTLGRRAAQERVTKLFKIASPEPGHQMAEDGTEIVVQLSSKTTKAMGEAINVKENKDIEVQAVRSAEATDEMDKLTKLGYEREGIPSDISQRQLDVLKMQRLNAERDYNSLSPMIAKQLSKLQVPASIRSQHELLVNSTDFDSDLRERLTEQLISWINDAHKNRETLTKSKVKSSEPVEPSRHRNIGQHSPMV